jgi:hypothetical protein
MAAPVNWKVSMVGLDMPEVAFPPEPEPPELTAEADAPTESAETASCSDFSSDGYVTRKPSDLSSDVVEVTAVESVEESGTSRFDDGTMLPSAAPVGLDVNKIQMITIINKE